MNEFFIFQISLFRNLKEFIEKKENFMQSLRNYNDLKFAIRCIDVWKTIKPSDDEINEV